MSDLDCEGDGFSWKGEAEKYPSFGCVKLSELDCQGDGFSWKGEAGWIR